MCRILTPGSLSSTPPNSSQFPSHTSLSTLPEAATQLCWQITQRNSAQPRHALLHFYSVHFHTSHNTEKVSKRNSNQLFHCIHVSSFPQFKISSVSNTVIKILRINRKCKKIIEENTFLLCYKKPLLLLIFPLTDDYLCLDSLLNIFSIHGYCCVPRIPFASWQPQDVPAHYAWGQVAEKSPLRCYYNSWNRRGFR